MDLSAHHEVLQGEQKRSIYADKLHITPKYLTMVVKEVGAECRLRTGYEYILQEIKFLLKLISEHPGDRYPDTFLQPDITWEVFQTTYGIVSFGLQKAELITSK